MGYHKRQRNSVNRNMRSLASDTVRSANTKPSQQVERMEVDSYKATLKHIRVNTRLGSRINIALAFESDTTSRECKRVIELYEDHIKRRYVRGQETYKAYAQKPNERVYTIHNYVRDYARKDKSITRQVIDEVLLWHKHNNDKRKHSLRKQHAIVGTYERPILRTA